MTLRDATMDDLDAFGAEFRPDAMRAVVGVVGGEPVGIAGLQRTPLGLVAFSRIKGALRGRRRDIIRLMQTCDERFLRGKFVIAVADESEPTAATLLEHFGFRHVDTTPIGEVYAKWPT